MSPTQFHGLLLSSDLLDGSKVTATALAQGHPVMQARSFEKFLSKLEEVQPRCVFIDLQDDTLELEKLLQEIREKCQVFPTLIGFSSHVDVARISAARSAGFTQVLARSQFFGAIENNLRQWFGAFDNSAAQSE